MKSIIWGNYKGGVGKTTSVFQVATYFANEGKKVLMIDLDPQCSLSNICCTSNGDRQLSEYKADEVFNFVIELYMRFINDKKDLDLCLLLDKVETPIQSILENLCVPLKNSDYKKNLYFIPSSISFQNCRMNELAQHMERNIFNIFLLQIFEKDLQVLNFDYVFIDCPPTSNILIQSSFLTSDYYIVPTKVDEISTKGVADYISEIEKTHIMYEMNAQIGSILMNKVFGKKTELLGVFETIYKERRGNADNTDQIITLDNNIDRITGVKSIISQEKYSMFRYSKERNKFSTNNIFKYYIGHRDNRSGGESIPMSTARGEQTKSYTEIANAILQIMEDQE